MACLEAQGPPPHPEQEAPRSLPSSDLDMRLRTHTLLSTKRKGEPATDVDAVRYALTRLSLTLPATRTASARWERHDGRFYDGNGTIMEEHTLINAVPVAADK
jgi:hypothetical protein